MQTEPSLKLVVDVHCSVPERAKGAAVTWIVHAGHMKWLVVVDVVLVESTTGNAMVPFVGTKSEKVEPNGLGNVEPSLHATPPPPENVRVPVPSAPIVPVHGHEPEQFRVSVAGGFVKLQVCDVVTVMAPVIDPESCARASTAKPAAIARARKKRNARPTGIAASRRKGETACCAGQARGRKGAGGYFATAGYSFIMAAMNNRNLVKGLFLIAIALAFGGGALRYNIGHLERVGPGFFPLMVSSLLFVLGAVMVLRSRFMERAPIYFNVKNVLIIMASLVGFALLSEHVNMTCGIVFLVFVSTLAGTTYSVRRNAIVAAVLLAIAFIFQKGLGLQLPLY